MPLTLRPSDSGWQRAIQWRDKDYFVTPTGREVPLREDVHLLWRADLLRDAKDNPERQDAFCRICAADAIWWLSAFGWTFDPRTEPKRQVFIPYPVQQDLLLEVLDCIHVGRDLLIPKSRDMGVSWIVMGAFTHCWLFEKDMMFLCISAKEELVDQKDEPKSLLYKADYLVENVPQWQRRSYQGRPQHRSQRHMFNPDTRGLIGGAASASDAGRAERCKAMALDEHAHIEEAAAIERATDDTAPCKIRISTPKGRANRFYKLIEQGRKATQLLWWEHPKKAQGLYRTVGGEIDILDTEFAGIVRTDPDAEDGDLRKFPEDYPFVFDDDEHEGKLHSPWYDYEVKRRGDPKDVAQEIDCDFGLSGESFFDGDTLTRLLGDCQDPWQRGELVFHYDYDKKRIALDHFEPAMGRRRLSLWCELDWKGRPTGDHNFVVACDISAGGNKSDSIINVTDVDEARKVAEFADSEISPEDLARMAVAVCYFFRGEFGLAFLIWEGNGYGGIFAKEIEALGYRHVYYHQDELSDRPKETNRPGWYSTRQSKITLIGEYRRALSRRDYTNPCELSIRQAMDFITYANGGIGPASLSENSLGEREAHGDRVIGDALAVRGMKEQPKAAQRAMMTGANTPHSRRQAFLRRKRRDDPWKP